MSINRIGIVGGGPAAISLIKQLLDSVKPGLKQPLKITVYEQGKKIGPGQAYSNPHDCYILNLPAADMGITPEPNNDFKTWLSSSAYRGTSNFPPRHFFGQYLEQVAAKLPEEAKDVGIELEYKLSTSVHNVLPLTSKEFIIKHFRESEKKDDEDELDMVVLCTGHLPSNTYNNFIGQSHYYHNPWDDSIYDKNSLGKQVGILGTRLTAIDTALRLKAIRYAGHIAMASRSGLLPAVLSTKISRPYNLKHLTLHSLFLLTKTETTLLRLSEILHLIDKEIQEASGGKEKFEFKALMKDHETKTPEAWLESEIKNANSPKPWQQVLLALYPILPFIWQRLSDSDKKEFMDKYYGTFLTYMAAFPLENAKKILEMINSGQLSVIGGVSGVEKNKEDTYSIHAHNKIIVDTLFNATGPGFDLESSPLFKKMEEKRIIARNILGGIKIDRSQIDPFSSYRVFNKKGIPYPGMFAIGNIITSEYLATNMSDIALQGSAMAAIISDQLLKKDIKAKTATFFWGTNSKSDSNLAESEIKKHL